MKRKIDLMLSLFAIIALLAVTACEEDDYSEYEEGDRNPSYNTGY